MKQLFRNFSMFADRSYFTVVMLFLMLFLSGLSSHTVSAELLVLYPEIRAPFSKIFEDIQPAHKRNSGGEQRSFLWTKMRLPYPLLKLIAPMSYCLWAREVC